MSNLLLYVIVVLIWGTSWYGIELQLGIVEPEVSVAYRYFAAAGILFAYCRIKGLDLRFELRHHRWFALLGLLIFCLNYVMAYRAQVHITSALAAIAFSSIVWMNIINARVFFGIRGTPRLYAGTALGIVGFLVLFTPQLTDIEYSEMVLYGFGIALIGALCASFGNMVMQVSHRDNLPAVQTNAWGMLYGAVLTTLLSVAMGHEFTIDTRMSYIVSFVYLTVFASVIAFVTYLTLLGRIGAQRAGYASVMFPVIALIISTIFEGLQLNLYILGGFALVLTGNVLVLSERERA